MHRIAVIPGDGTGPEVVREGLKVLEAVARATGFTYETKEYDFGGDRYLKTGEALPESAIDELREAGASEESLERVQAPIGLDIGSVTVSEIALSIAAQLVEARREGYRSPVSGPLAPGAVRR